MGFDAAAFVASRAKAGGPGSGHMDEFFFKEIQYLYPVLIHRVPTKTPTSSLVL
jgi:hypothetical protein